MQTLIDESMIDICIEEDMSPEQVFFAFLCCRLYPYRLSKHIFFVCKTQLIFSGDQEKEPCRSF